jgi:hypothetical protein
VISLSEAFANIETHRDKLMGIVGELTKRGTDFYTPKLKELRVCYRSSIGFIQNR